jgi:hypothetical protein
MSERVKFTAIAVAPDGPQSHAAVYALDTEGRVWGISIRDLGVNQAQDGEAWWIVPAPKEPAR